MSRPVRADNLNDEQKSPRSTQSFGFMDVHMSEDVQCLLPPSKRCTMQTFEWTSERVSHASNERLLNLQIPIAQILDDVHLSPMAHLLKFTYARRNHATNEVVHVKYSTTLMDYRLGSIGVQIRDGERLVLDLRRSNAYRKRWDSELEWLRDHRFNLLCASYNKRLVEFLSQETATADRYLSERLAHFRHTSKSYCEILRSERSHVREVMEKIDSIKHVQIFNCENWPAETVVLWLCDKVCGLELSQDTQQRMHYITGDRLWEVNDLTLLTAGIENGESRQRILECIEAIGRLLGCDDRDYLSPNDEDDDDDGAYDANDSSDEFEHALESLEKRLRRGNLFHIVEIIQDLTRLSLEDLMKIAIEDKADLTRQVETVCVGANKCFQKNISQAQIEPFVDAILSVVTETGVNYVCQSQEEYLRLRLRRPAREYLNPSGEDDNDDDEEEDNVSALAK